MPEEIPSPLAALLEMFDATDKPDERAMLLLEKADQYREVPPAIATRPYPADHRVEFCESEAYVWVIPQQDGTLRLHFAVENPSGVSAKALATVLEKGLSGLTPEEIVRVPDDIVNRIFRQNMSMGKGMGLTSLVHTVKAMAARYVKERV